MTNIDEITCKFDHVCNSGKGITLKPVLTIFKKKINKVIIYMTVIWTISQQYMIKSMKKPNILTALPILIK